MVANGIEEDRVIRIKRNPWADNFFRPLLITIMIMCLSISIVNMVRLVNPAWRGTYFLIGMLLTTVEAIYSYRVCQQFRKQHRSTLRYRLAEVAVLVLMLKLLSFMDKPMSRVGAELQAMWHSPTTLLNVEFYLILCLAAIAWIAATETISDFEALYDPYTSNTRPLANLAGHFFWGGAILMIISGITQWVILAGAGSLTDLQRPTLSGVIFNVLVYFTVGLVLLSQVNLTAFTVRWRVQNITVVPGLTKQWAKYGLIFLGLITLIAFLLPTRYSLGFLATAGIVVLLLIRVLVFIFQVIILLLTLPLAWLMSFLGLSLPQSGTASAPTLPPMPPSSPGTPVPWLEVLRSLVFWLVALAITWYLVKSYLDDQPELVKRLKGFTLIGFIIRLLAQFWELVKGWTRAGLDMIPTAARGSELEQDNASATNIWNWLGLRRLSPRERILYYYLNILKRAERHGSTRQADQTPYEYEPDLQQSVPNVQSEVHVLTDVFVRARYSQQGFTEKHARLVKQQWQQIRKALGRTRDTGDERR